MIKGKVVSSAIFVSDSGITLSYENELKVVKAGDVIDMAKITFKLPSSWSAFKKVVCVKSGEKKEYIPLNSDSCQMPNKFNGCAGVTLQVITEDENGNLFSTNEVILN